ncbi:MAG: D-glycero-beta-D-manno-heptose-7-phosphate kinase [Gemmatimonadota bacterium]
MSDIVDRLASSSVVVVGDVMWDEQIWGHASRISPEAPVPVVEVERVSGTPGGAANVAVNARALGARVAVVGLVGEDGAGEALRAGLQASGLDTGGLLVDGGRPTTRKSRVLARGQQVVRIDREMRAPISDAQGCALLEALDEPLRHAGVVVVSDYAKGVVQGRLVRGIVERARARGIPVLVDPKGLDFAKYEGVDLITPNQQEASGAAAIEITDRASLERAALRLRELTQARALLITRGGEGMALFEDGPPTYLPAATRQVYDVTGAGDTAVATLALALAAGVALADAARLANRAAGIVVEKVGTASVSAAELRDVLARA